VVGTTARMTTTREAIQALKAKQAALVGPPVALEISWASFRRRRYDDASALSTCAFVPEKRWCFGRMRASSRPEESHVQTYG